MKKQLTILVILFWVVLGLRAQQSGIIYTDFEPDSLVELKEIDFYPDAQMNIDMDADGNNDLRIYARATSGGWWFYIMSYSTEWEIHEYQIEDPLIPMNEHGGWYTGINLLPYDYQGYYTTSEKFAVRHQVGEYYYYGWFRAYLLMNGTSSPWVALDKMAYCTIPDYPLIWGQTELTPMGEEGAEWYYEIINDNGSITYQYLQCAGDTTINNERPKVIVRSNTQYDRGEITKVTHEYIYEENGIVYWWNKTLEEFTVLYDLTANTGDEWETKVGMESIVMHVDAVESIEYEGKVYRMLRVSDENDIFNGDIVCGIGHLTSFFPERLMNLNKGYRVEGLRCYWIDGDLAFKIGDKDCDELYQQYHNSINEPNGNGFTVYPDSTNGVLFVQTLYATSLLAEQKYRITNMLGQTVLQGHLTAETQQINIENLSAGLYFLSVGNMTQKFVKQ